LTAAISGMLHEDVPITDFLELSVNSPSAAAPGGHSVFIMY
jgi:hypothetical protein